MECGEYQTITAAQDAASAWLKHFPDGDYEIGVGEPKQLGEVKVFREVVK